MVLDGFNCSNISITHELGSTLVWCQFIKSFFTLTLVKLFPKLR
uniref:Uncharacterized protein n=1 Tax=Setaria italica TaxID=4555 RepID=K4A3U6_SETIT